MSARHNMQIAAAAVLVAAFGTVASAQVAIAPSVQVQVQPRDPNMPAPQNTPPEKIAPSGSGQTLSDKLERSDGVIKPPGNIDPGISAAAPVPDPGTTPVISPPGSPGGNPNVQPK